MAGGFESNKQEKLEHRSHKSHQTSNYKWAFVEVKSIQFKQLKDKYSVHIWFISRTKAWKVLYHEYIVLILIILDNRE